MDGAQPAVTATALADLRSRLGTAHAVLLPVIEADGLRATEGSRSFASWVARRHRLPWQTADRQVRLGRTLRDDLPQTATAALAGEVTHDNAQVLATHTTTTDLRRAALADPDVACHDFRPPRRPAVPRRPAPGGAAVGRHCRPRRRRPRLHRSW